ncbi:carbon starvation CstA family protein, partial [Yersinia pestis PY-95]
MTVKLPLPIPLKMAKITFRL